MGHKRLAIEAGEDPVNNPIEYVLDCIHTIYSIKHKNGAIRRVNVNIAATTVENYRKLKEAGIGTYILFQETYHKESYRAAAPHRPQAATMPTTPRPWTGPWRAASTTWAWACSSAWSCTAMSSPGLLMHAEHLEAVHGVGPHTISVPRVKHADDIDPDAFDNGIDDDTFLQRSCACIRVAVPYTGMIMSTRENQSVRERALHLGISQISPAAAAPAWAATPRRSAPHDTEQFDVSDNRTLDEVVRLADGDWGTSPPSAPPATGRAAPATGL